MNKHLLNLDGMRGIAALVVISDHMTNPFDIYIFRNGHLAVDFFFALSGFVIALSYEQKLRSGQMSFLGFVSARLKRLHPLIVLGATLGAVVYVLRFGASPDSLLRLAGAFYLGILLIPTSLITGPGYLSSHPLNPPTWSLFAEYVVNILYAAVVRHLNTALLLVCGGAGVVLSSIALWTYGTLSIGWSYNDWWWGLVRVIFPFFAGVALFRLWSSGRTLPTAPFGVLSVILIAALATPEGALTEGVVVYLVIPALVLLGATYGEKRSRLKEMMGYLSYPMYVLHFPVVRVFSNLIRRFDLEGPALVAAFVAEFVAIVVLSYLAARLFEEPIRRWLGQRRQPQVA